MKTKEEIMGRLARLKEISPAEAEGIFAPLEEAVEAHFQASPELTLRVTDAAYQVAFSHEYQNTKYENDETIGAEPFDMNAKPKGYDDVQELFDGGGVWEEMDGIDEQEFVDAFILPAAGGDVSTSDTGGDSEGGETAEPENPYLKDWAARVEAARAAIIPGLIAISDYCEQGAATFGMAMYFEEPGDLVSAPTRPETAERVYIAGGYLALIRAYGLPVYQMRRKTPPFRAGDIRRVRR